MGQPGDICVEVGGLCPERTCVCVCVSLAVKVQVHVGAITETADVYIVGLFRYAGVQCMKVVLKLLDRKLTAISNHQLIIYELVKQKMPIHSLITASLM